MFVSVPVVAFSFQAPWFLALGKSCLAAVSADTALLEQSSLLCHGSEETLPPFPLVSTEDLHPCDTGSK